MQAADNDSAIAQAFVDARRKSAPIKLFPGMAPVDLDHAYRIQDAALAIWNRPVGGWKVGRINPPDDSILGANRLIGPIFADSIVDHAGHDGEIAPPAMPVFSGGFAAAEAEFMISLRVREGEALPSSNEEVLAWVNEIRIGIEIASSPYALINEDGPCVTVSDHGNNAGLVLGRPIPPEYWYRLKDIEVETLVNGISLATTTTATMLDGPLGAVRFLLANLKSRGIAPLDGWWVSSGAVTGVHEVSPGDHVCARFAGQGEIACTIAAA